MSSTGPIELLPGLVNAHLHSPYGPYSRGVTRSRPFEIWMGDIMAREDRPLTVEEVEACALVTGLENLSVGNTALMDQHFGIQSQEHMVAAARAYEALGLRAWIFFSLSDLPYLCYTREAFPNYPKAIPTADLPEELQAMMQPFPLIDDQLNNAANVIRGWHAKKVKIGLGLSNPVWCSDELLRAAAALARELDAPLAIHLEEPPVQREVSFGQWGMSGVERLARLGLLSERTLAAHVVQLDDADVQRLAHHRVSVSHNPISNLKLQNGITPVGKMVAAGFNVCLGSDGQASGDSQNLFTVIKFVAALAEFNGLRELNGIVEEMALHMATENGRRLWFEGDLSQDYIEFSEPLGPYGYAWDEPAAYIAEVYVDRIPRVARAQEIVRERGAAARGRGAGQSRRGGRMPQRLASGDGCDQACHAGGGRARGRGRGRGSRPRRDTC